MRVFNAKMIGAAAIVMVLQMTSAICDDAAKTVVIVDPQTVAFRQAVTAQKDAAKKIHTLQKDLKAAQKTFDATLEKESAAQDKTIKEKMAAIDRLLGRKAPKIEACKPGEKTPGCVDCAANKGRCVKGFCCD